MLRLVVDFCTYTPSVVSDARGSLVPPMSMAGRPEACRCVCVGGGGVRDEIGVGGLQGCGGGGGSQG